MSFSDKPCDRVQPELPLYSYGELSSEVEEAIEAHLAECVECRVEFDRQRKFLDILDNRRDTVDASLLAVCRNELRSAIAAKKRPSFWEWQIPLRIPVGAMALVAVGFFGARMMPDVLPDVVPVAMRSSVQPMFSSVASVEPDTASGLIRVSVDDVRRRVVSGTPDDPRIESLLLSAIREESNPGLRVESIGILKRNADSEQVREALIDRLTRDPNPGVRLKALEGLKSYAGDAEVRHTLANVLLKDDNPGVRVQAIDLLTTHHDDSIVGVLQDAVRKEDNNYVRLRCGRLLEEMKASVGTY
jgi:hypothetical protein